MTDLLYVADLTLAYGKRSPVVQGLTFEIAPGESLGLVGSSGSGKSLTASTLLGFTPRDCRRIAGHAAYMTKERLTLDLLAVGERELISLRGKEIGYIAQNPLAAFNPVQRCGAQLQETIKRLRPEVIDPDAILQEILQQVELGDLAARVMSSFPHQLSGGQLQRVLIANALIGRPRLLIADEPTTALDKIVEGEILGLLNHLRRDRGMSMLFITHDLTTLGKLTDRAIGMDGQSVSIRAQRKIPLVPASSPRLPLLSVERLTIVHEGSDKAAVSGCSLSVGKGEYVALLGPSGCGKSTLASWLVGLLPARVGGATCDASAVSFTDSGATIRKKLGTQLIFQQVAASLNPRLTIAQVLRELHHLHGGTPIDKLLRLVGLDPEEVGGRYPNQLSGGQQQRFCIARALAALPRVLICDEALSALDAPLKRGIQSLLRRLSRELGLGILFITHDVSEVLAYADRILVMDDGSICEETTGQQFLDRPQSAIGRKLLYAAGLSRE